MDSQKPTTSQATVEENTLEEIRLRQRVLYLQQYAAGHEFHLAAAAWRNHVSKQGLVGYRLEEERLWLALTKARETVRAVRDPRLEHLEQQQRDVEALKAPTFNYAPSR